MRLTRPLDPQAREARRREVAATLQNAHRHLELSRRSLLEARQLVAEARRRVERAGVGRFLPRRFDKNQTPNGAAA